MAITLGFHIVFAAVGMAMPFFMAVSHFRYLRRRNPVDLALTKLWSRGVAIFFATGAVSGTVLAFELGLLWPGFMKHAGSIIGMPFAWEGTAFFLEAVALGLFLYGWNRLPEWVHWFSGLVVGISGVASGIFVISANGWMNAPTGFEWTGSRATHIDPVAAMFNEAWAHQAIHMVIAAFEAVGFAVAGLHAFLLLKKINPALNLRAIKIALAFGALAAIVQPLSGDFSSRWVVENQPEKFAAMESLFHTQKGAPLHIGGIQIPGLLSFLAHRKWDAEVIGLDRFERALWPPVSIVRVAFQIMIALGVVLMLISLLYFWFAYRSRTLPSWFLRCLVVLIPSGFVAMEAGWIVTEVGRQPWIIYRVLKTSEAVTPMPGMVIHLLIFCVIYLILSIAVTWLMRRQIIVASQADGDNP